MNRMELRRYFSDDPQDEREDDRSEDEKMIAENAEEDVLTDCHEEQIRRKEEKDNAKW